MTDDVADRRRARFLRHIAGAEARGEALAARLPRRRARSSRSGAGRAACSSPRRGRGWRSRGWTSPRAGWSSARRRLADHGLSVPLVAASAERLPWPDGRFDAVVADSVLEHLDDPRAALREWAPGAPAGGAAGRLVAEPVHADDRPAPRPLGPGLAPAARGCPATSGSAAGTPGRPGRSRRPRRGGWRPRPGCAAVAVDAPAIPDRWARTRPRAERLAIRAYAAARSARADAAPAPRRRPALGAAGDQEGGRMIDPGDRPTPARRADAPATGRPPTALRPTGLAWVLASELFAGGARVRGDGPPGPPARAVGVRAGRVRRGGRGLAARGGPRRGGRDRLPRGRAPAAAGPAADRRPDRPAAASRRWSATRWSWSWPRWSGRARGAVVAVAGLLLFPSAFVADVGLRAAGRLGRLALAQAVRALGLRRGRGWCWSAGRATCSRAAWCLVLAEAARRGRPAGGPRAGARPAAAAVPAAGVASSWRVGGRSRA